MPSIFSPTTAAVRPLMPVSISSNISVGTRSLSAKMDLKQSIIRLSSPPDATFSRGFSGSPGFALSINSAVSRPPFRGSPPDASLSATSNIAFAMPRSFSSFSTSRFSLSPAARRTLLSSSAATLYSAFSLSSFASSSAASASAFSSSFSLVPASLPKSITSSTVRPYFRLRSDISFSRCSISSSLCMSLSTFSLVSLRTKLISSAA